ncbi:hypothetical protein KS4_30500 [Poriferisphaera corsica]|uniref:Uncharacterized protein n=1 Tax=Poriferisphaera corsica TaxID=2528020 RepID=A0A517YXM7_9BACT|nr:hypothetical protein [Poriferisphaera corsica]QDU34973.1 hypothetical protein KS4_30500 [Poriferisphaera corsica]
MTINFSWGGMIILSLLLILMGGVILVILGFTWKRTNLKHEGREGESICGHCGYIVLGIEHMICPECGNDLRKVGIVKVGSEKKRRTGLIWGGIVMIIFSLILFFLLTFTVVKTQTIQTVPPPVNITTNKVQPIQPTQSPNSEHQNATTNPTMNESVSE